LIEAQYWLPPHLTEIFWPQRARSILAPRSGIDRLLSQNAEHFLAIIAYFLPLLVRESGSLDRLIHREKGPIGGSQAVIVDSREILQPPSA
jgi:hypothetical protein